MKVSKWLKENKEILKQYQNKGEYFADFETLTGKNKVINEYGNETSKVYLWGLKTPKMETLWGTTIEDFWETLLLVSYKPKNMVLNKMVYFVNFDYDYQFIKTLLADKYTWLNIDYPEWLELKNKYQQNKANVDNVYHLIMSNNRAIMLTLLTGGRVIQIKCLWRLTSLSVEKMEKSLTANKIPTPKKLKSDYDYDLVDKVYDRKTFFEMVYEKDIDYKTNFLKTDLGKEDKYKYHLKYIDNDIIIPAKHFQFFKKLLQKVNVKFAGGKFGTFVNGRMYGIGKQIDKPTIKHRTKKYGTKKMTLKLSNGVSFSLVKILKANPQFTFTYTDFEMEHYGNIDIVGGKEIWVLTNHLQMYKNFGFEYEVLDQQYREKINVKQLLSHKSITMSGLTFAAYKKYVGKEKFKEWYGDSDNNILTYKEYDFVNRAFQGGLTNFNTTKRYDSGRVISLDINSSYPYQMLQELPIGKPLYKKPKGKSIGFINVNILSFELKDPNKMCPFFPKWKVNNKVEGGRLYTEGTRYLTYYYAYDKDHYGKFNASFVLDEWNYLNKHYNIVYEKKSVKKMYFKVEYVARDYIETLKDIKLNAKTIGEKEMGKLAMNGLYGKFSQKVLLQEKYVIDLEKDNIKQVKQKLYDLSNIYSHTDIYGIKQNQLSMYKYIHLKDLLNNPSKVFSKDYGFLTFLNEKRTKFYFSYYKQIENEWLRFRQVGAVITWKARKQLLEVVENIGWDNTRYFDTDSIYFDWNKKTQKIFTTMKESGKIKIDDKELGAWCFEKEMESMKILGAKKYQLKVSKTYEGNGKWKEVDKWDYRFAGLSKPNEVFARVGHDKFKAGVELKNVSYKKENLDTGAIIEITNFILKEGGG